MRVREIRSYSTTQPIYEFKNNMRFFFGLPNAGPISDVSPELQARNINLCKAAPRQIVASGRYTLEQPAYECYSFHLPEFIHATATSRITSFGTGYPIKTAATDCFPRPEIRLGCRVTRPSDDFLEAVKPFVIEENKRTEGKGKDSKLRITYILTAKTGFPAFLQKHSKHLDANYDPPAGLLPTTGYIDVITIIRIFSGFFRTHLYPAYSTTETTSPEKHIGHRSTTKRLLDEQDESLSKRAKASSQASKSLETITRWFKKVPKAGTMDVSTGFSSNLVDPTLPEHKDRIAAKDPLYYSVTKPVEQEVSAGDVEMEEPEEQVKVPEIENVLSAARPSPKGILPWGNTNDIPNTDGIVLPYIPELAHYDNAMVPDTIEQFFLGCLGQGGRSTTEEQLLHLDQIRQTWNAGTHRTPIANMLAHMAKVISICVRGQARPFPVFVDGEYTGCYGSGAKFSILTGGRAFIRPESFDKNFEDMKLLGGHRHVLDRIRDVVADECLTEPEVMDFKLKFDDKVKTLLDLHDIIMEEEPGLETVNTLKELARDLRFAGQYDEPTPANVDKHLRASINGERTKGLTVIHLAAFLTTDTFMLNFSAFGPQVPSPNIPGGDEITPKPGKPAIPMGRNPVYRRTVLSSAVDDWKDLLRTGSCLNLPKKRSGRFLYTNISGDKRTLWWESMAECIILNAQKLTGPSGEKVGTVSSDTLRKEGEEEENDLEGF